VSDRVRVWVRVNDTGACRNGECRIGLGLGLGFGLGLGLVTQVRVGMVSVGMVLVGIVRVGMVTCTRR